LKRENETFDRKSIRYILEKHKDADDLACDCVGFANATGGVIQLGIEDREETPPPDQRVDDNLPEQIGKRLPQITINVGVVVNKEIASNGGEFIEIRIFGNEQSIASTSDGRYFLRVSDETRRLMPDDLGRLVSERNSFVWELQTTKRISWQSYDRAKYSDFIEQIQDSDRVSSFVKEKAERELLEYYQFVRSNYLTNLGILWIGNREDRAALLYPPEIQCIKYDELGRKIQKYVWSDYSMNPRELIEAVWKEVPDWKEAYELPDGLFRRSIPVYDEVVVRELLANALVHRPYTQRGDVFLNLHPDRLEVHNPGLLPIGVTPYNILHTSIKRNTHLAKVFYDLKLMEGEGSGFDRMYEVLLTSGRPAPNVKEGDDRVVITVEKRITKPKIVDFIIKADQTYSLNQKEFIALGLITQHEAITAIDMITALGLSITDDLKSWIERLRKWSLIKSRGRTKATEYFIDPTILRTLDFKGGTTLKGIEKHRLKELVLSDLEIYRKASISQIHERIGGEIPRRKLRVALSELVKSNDINLIGCNKGAYYYWTKTA
jgi:ATP-dependent DNA helicase RecG